MQKKSSPGWIIGAALLGFVVGVFFDSGQISLTLGIAGAMGVILFNLQTRLKALELRLQEKKGVPPAAAEPADPEADILPEIEKTPLQPDSEPQATKKSPKETFDPGYIPISTPPPMKSAADQAPEQSPTVSQKTGILISAFLNFFTKGNVVVKVGVIILFFGVGFLIKYASEHSLLPPELRLAGAGAAGIALLALGFRLRKSQQGYATILQGAGIGVLYLSVYGAARLYALLPLGGAFAIMVGIVLFSGILAVRQGAKSLAVFGILGGFLSPILMSTGEGSHVTLFSYYALLNLGIFGIAWFKSWRILNWLGFIFTFCIGFLWGAKFYRPEYFSTTEPFLVLHFFFYAIISILFAHKQPVKLKGYLDGTLIFGLPVVAFGLQSALVREIPFGMAYSALCAGGFYILACALLWRRNIQGMKALCESFLAVGVVFISLAIPFALDSGWTSGLWALEGAGILWVGFRQGRRLPKAFGILLQVGAGVAFINTLHGPYSSTPVINGVCMSAAAIAAAGFVSNFFMQKYRTSDSRMAKVSVMTILWGFLWWFGSGFNEIFTHIPQHYEFAAVLIFCSCSAMLFSTLQLKLKWKEIGYPLILLPVFTLAVTVISLAAGGQPHLFADFGWSAYLLLGLVLYHLLFHHEKIWQKKTLEWMHALTLYLVILVLSAESAWAISQVSVRDSVWPLLAWGGIPALFIYLLPVAAGKISWPMAAFQIIYCREGLLLPSALVGVWMVFLSFHPADPAPLPYTPVLNPGDIAHLLSLLVLFQWLAALDIKDTRLPEITRETGNCLLAGLGFLWMNTQVARCVHYWTGIPFHLERMLDSVFFQAGISILWTIVALGTMILAHRTGRRPVWFTGAGLISAVVLKLFLIDLAGINTIARIVSFLAVGGLMLVMGYFSPLPPKTKENAS